MTADELRRFAEYEYTTSSSNVDLTGEFTGVGQTGHAGTDNRDISAVAFVMLHATASLVEAIDRQTAALDRIGATLALWENTRGMR